MNLVLQGPSLTKTQAAELARIAGTGSLNQFSNNVFKLKIIKEKVSVADWCHARRIDHAWMPEGLRFADLKLVAMDMDSTLITIECIDELGDMAGKKAEVAAITAQAMRGELDYAASLRKRVALLEGLDASVLNEVYEKRLLLTPGAEQLIATCKKHDVKLLLVSGGFSFFT